MNEITLIQFMFLFGVTIVFSMVSLNRQTMVSFLLASILWFTSALANFMLNPAETLSMTISYIFVALGIIFMLASLKALGESVSERKAERFKVTF